MSNINFRLRFAPSPTGHLHIGGARTAIFNWLFARHNKGEFILRIEDTDKERSQSKYVDAIISSLEWLGLYWDEGPYFQSERMDIYRECVEYLLNKGNAYYCYCTPEELEERRKVAISQGKKPGYDGRCRNLMINKSNKPAAIRFRAPEEGITKINDLIKGKIIFNNSDIDDFIIQRSDGLPTYNFAVVVDDAKMGITHIIRGDDHINNTPKQIYLYKALNYPIPEFAHVPMILGSDKTRLSKRHGATSVIAYKEMGYLPQAIVNYLVRLGWSFGDQEIFNIDELIEKFSLENVGKSAAIFNPEKLLWLNSHYIKESENENLVKLLIPFIERKGYKFDNDDYLIKVVATLKERCKTLAEMVDYGDFYFKENIKYEEKGVKKYLKNRDKVIKIFEIFISRLREMDNYTIENIENIFKDISTNVGIKLVDIAQAIRIVLTGRTISPGIYEVMEALGKERTINRILRGKEFVNNNII
jgi:glutamyl-tRNA synthetase